MKNTELVSQLDARTILQKVLGEGYVVGALKLLLNCPGCFFGMTRTVLDIVILLFKQCVDDRCSYNTLKQSVNKLIVVFARQSK
jgi:hypothetical protein